MRQGSLDWSTDGVDWPLREHSRFVEVDGHRFHVQQLGDAGPGILLLHGAGASTHSFRDFAPYLARWARVVVPDLPGHAFSRPPRDFGYRLPDMARALGRLLEVLGVRVDVLVGHSAGAAIGLQAVLSGRLRPAGIVAMNPALVPFRGPAAVLFPVLARVGARSGWARQAVGLTGRSSAWVRRTLEGTGSRLDARGIELYRRLAASADHVEGTIRMMAAWDLRGFADRLGRIDTPVDVLAGARDRAVPLARIRAVKRAAPRFEVTVVARVGHLGHEEQPRAFADRVAASAAARLPDLDDPRPRA